MSDTIDSSHSRNLSAAVTANVGIVSTFGRSTNTSGFLERMVKVQSSLAQSVHVIAPDEGFSGVANVVFHPVRYAVGRNPFVQALNQLTAQVGMSALMVRRGAGVRVWTLYGGDFLIMPALTAKLTGRRVLVALAGNLENETRLKPSVLNGAQLTMRKMVLALSDRVIVYSPVLVREWKLERYRKKLLVADVHFIDLDAFKMMKPLAARGKVVGYVGRLSAEKGVLNLADAVVTLLRQDASVRFEFVGDGPLASEMISRFEAGGVGDRVKMLGRVQWQQVPAYLNNLTLCVLPSYTEGMPNVVLESMACGTPVLSTPVGAVSDIISDSTTGFLMKDNSADTIAASIPRALQHPRLIDIARSARELVEKRFSFAAAKGSYVAVFDSIGHGN